MNEANKDIARPIYAATESGDVSILDSVLAADAVEHPLNPGQVRGREAIKQMFGGFYLIVPDLSSPSKTSSPKVTGSRSAPPSGAPRPRPTSV